jgi:hypothetical protein
MVTGQTYNNQNIKGKIELTGQGEDKVIPAL